MARQLKRFTQFDAMEARGDFEANPANAGSTAYEGPVDFPRMLFAAEEEVIVSGTFEEIRGRGTILLGEQKALRHRIVGTKGELDEALASGEWFDHPAKALKSLIEANRAQGVEDKRTVPIISAQETINSYERRIAELEAKLSEANEHKGLAAASPPIRGRAAPRTSTLDD
jgi:hypothetical protein